MLTAPVDVPTGEIAAPANTASPSRIALPEIFNNGAKSSLPSVDTAKDICFMLLTFCGTVKLEDTDAPAKLSIAWNEVVADNPASVLVTTIAMFNYFLF